MCINGHIGSGFLKPAHCMGMQGLTYWYVQGHHTQCSLSQQYFKFQFLPWGAFCIGCGVWIGLKFWFSLKLDPTFSHIWGCFLADLLHCVCIVVVGHLECYLVESWDRDLIYKQMWTFGLGDFRVPLGPKINALSPLICSDGDYLVTQICVH